MTDKIARTRAALSGVPLFEGLSKRHLSQLAASADSASFSGGEAIVRQGGSGEILFVLIEGEAKVVRDGRIVARLLPGDSFGEVSVVDGGPRSASVFAETPVRAITVLRKTVEALIRREPAVTLKLLEVLARRIRQIERPLNA